jgi:aminomethyltransferase
MPETKKTCLYESHVELGARMESFAGYWMPIVYESIQKEHLAVREEVGMFDVSHMGEFLIKGKDALRFVDHIFSNEILSKPFGKVVYGFMLYENGTIVDDLLVYLVSEEECFLVVNASNIAKDYEWVVENTEGFEVTVKNLSEEYSEIALQGPKAEILMLDLFKVDLSNFEFFTFQNVVLDDEIFLISRTGYTGEDGFEIYGFNDQIPSLWEKFYANGVVPCGLGARDTLRFEAALPLYGHEISDQVTPITAGLKTFAKTEKPEFIGKTALLKELETGSKQKVVGLELTEMAIPRQGYPVYANGVEIGQVTTGYLSISINKPIAMALIDEKYSKLGTLISVGVRKKLVPGFVRDKKFLKKNYKTK